MKIYVETFCHFGGGKKPSFKSTKLEGDSSEVDWTKWSLSKTSRKDLTFRNIADVSEKFAILCFFLKSLSYVLPHDLYGIIWVRCFLGRVSYLQRSEKCFQEHPATLFHLRYRLGFHPLVKTKLANHILSSD